MSSIPLISICIPAYKRADLLQRLLESIAIQSWKDFEVIVTDDSPDDPVLVVCRQYEGRFPLSYYRNNVPLGTPENWNEGIRRARGKWIKLMHDDDWFAGSDSLAVFARTAGTHPSCSFIFSAYTNCYPDGRKKNILITPFRYRALLKRPATLSAGNCIGPPSCVLYEKREGLFFEKRFKWLVDIDFYIRYLQPGLPQSNRPGSGFTSAQPASANPGSASTTPSNPAPKDKAFYISDPLVNIGISDTQVTRESFRVREVEIPENLFLLERVGISQLRNLLIFDAWWRLIRNLHIREVKDIRDAGFAGEIPGKISAMVRFQSRLPFGMLGIGPLSKLLMLSCFIFTSSIRDHD